MCIGGAFLLRVEQKYMMAAGFAASFFSDLNRDRPAHPTAGRRITLFFIAFEFEPTPCRISSYYVFLDQAL